MKKFKVPVAVKEFATHFKNKGFLIFIVGGAIRDSLLKNGNNDFDLPPMPNQQMF
jgi:tRNA nucleotidyltransferase/poly(A) polymerase